MDGFAYPYLDLASVPTVGSALLEPRPAFVFSADGSRLLWTNAAGCTFLGESHICELLRLRFSDLNPIKAQAARLSRLLPSEISRLEILRFGRGVSLITAAAACRRLNLPGEMRAVFALAIGTNGGAPQSVAARAERLVDMLATNEAMAAVLTADGMPIAVAGDGGALALPNNEIRALVAEARSSATQPARSIIGGRQAGAVRFVVDGRDLCLLTIEPAGQAVPLSPASPESISQPSVPDEMPVEAMLPDVDEPSAPSAPEAETRIIRFAWEMDDGLRFTFASPELADVIGNATAAVIGQTWRQVSTDLGLDPDGRIGAALEGGTHVEGTVYWPVEASGDRVAVDLAGLPRRAGDPGRGYRGFGFVRLEDRRTDERRDRPLPDGKQAQQAEIVAESLPAPEPYPADADRDDLDSVARKDIEEGPVRRPLATSAGDQTEPSNIVRLPHQMQRTPVETLTGAEREAFRRIAEVLKAPPGEAPPDTTPVEAPPRRSSGGEATADFDARLLDRLPVGVVIFRDRRTLFANRPLLELLGYESYEDFLAAGGAEALFPGADDIAANIAKANGDLAAVRSDGSALPVAARLHAVQFAGATALMLSVVAAPGERDDDAAIEVARSEARADELEAILDTATDGVVVIDVRGRIGSMNRSAEALFGVNGTEYVGRYFTDLLADESQKPALDYLDGLAANGVASVLNDGREVIGRVPQGGLIPLFMTMGRIAGTDKFCAVLRDITHWKNVEEELVAARRSAEAANQQKSDFLAKISHEIRTPLNAIIGFSEVMMEERFGPIGNTRYRDYLRDIHVSGAHLMSLINDLLDLSKIEAGKLDLSFESVAVNTGIQECVALMQPQANRERIIIRTSLASELPNVVADPRSFRQILLNLLSNAIKFTRAGGQVIVSTALEESGEVAVRIRDTGIGMTEKDIETALKPFRQVALSRDDRDHGTGLGLPLTKALVEANRATFAIESAPNQGTLVKITFPTTRVLAG
jgi:PAS domain S-box-containing protein